MLVEPKGLNTHKSHVFRLGQLTTFKKINSKWFAEWLNPMGLDLEINNLVNDNVSAEIVELLQE